MERYVHVMAVTRLQHMYLLYMGRVEILRDSGLTTEVCQERCRCVSISYHISCRSTTKKQSDTVLVEMLTVIDCLNSWNSCPRRIKKLGK